MFTAHSRATSRSLTTWRVWRSRRRSTRSNGFLSRTPPTSCSPPMVSHLAQLLWPRWQNGQRSHKCVMTVFAEGVIHSLLRRIVRCTAEIKGDVININSEWLSLWAYWCFAWRSRRHQPGRFRLSTSCMAATAGNTLTHIYQIMCHRAPHMYAGLSRHIHISRETSCRLWCFMHGRSRSASGGWGRWCRFLWRWPRCSDTNTHCGN